MLDFGCYFIKVYFFVHHFNLKCALSHKSFKLGGTISYTTIHPRKKVSSKNMPLAIEKWKDQHLLICRKIKNFFNNLDQLKYRWYCLIWSFLLGRRCFGLFWSNPHMTTINRDTHVYTTAITITAWHLRANQHVTMEISSHLSSHTDIDHLPVVWWLLLFNTRSIPFLSLYVLSLS